MAFDVGRGITVLFGGQPFSLSPFFADTWEWNGTAWRNVTPSSPNPSPRYRHAMAYDEARGKTVLFGGYDGSTNLSDTWEWDGTVWTRRSPSCDPGARREHALAYDPTFGRTVLFGGYAGGANPYQNDTWFWNGTDWGRAPALTPPPARSQHALAYDASRRRAVLFGGYNGSSLWLGDTWELAESATPIAVQGNVLLRTSNSTRIPVVGAGVKVSQNGIPGWIGEGVTDAAGQYVITLPSSARPGSYTIRASLTFDPQVHPPVVNYRYCNPAQRPELNPDRDSIQLSSGVNPNLDIYIPQPVVLVHGIFGDRETWAEAEALLRVDPRHKSRAGTPPGWDPQGRGWIWRGPVAARGYIALSVSYGPWQEHVQRGHDQNAVQYLAPEIDRFRNDILARYLPRTAPIDIVAHSMGGLVSRAYLHYQAAPNVSRVLMFGTPNLGLAAFFCPPCLYVAPPPFPPIPFHITFLWPGLGWQAVMEMHPVFLHLYFNPFRNPNGAKFLFVGSDRSRSCEPEGCFPGLLPPEDDEFVSTLSAHYVPPTIPMQDVLGLETAPDRHTELHTNVNGTLTDRLLRYLEERGMP